MTLLIKNVKWRDWDANKAFTLISLKCDKLDEVNEEVCNYNNSTRVTYEIQLTDCLALVQE